MPVVIAILAILAAMVVVVFVTANRRRASLGGLSRETIASDRSAPGSSELVPVGASTTDLEAEGRSRADETRASHGGLPMLRRRGEVVEWEPVDEEEIGVSRRQFLNRGVLGAVGLSAATFGAGVLAFLWPTSSGGLGGKVTAGKLDDILADIADKREPFYVPVAKTYIQPYPQDALAAAKKVYPPNIYAGMEEAGVTALSQRCVHLGCRVPWCQTSQWFECPCHGSKYNRVGEKKDGPAPRGLDRWPVVVEGGNLVIDTAGTVVTGPPIGTNTTKQQQEGPSCV